MSKLMDNTVVTLTEMLMDKEAELAQARAELEQWKRRYVARGEALARPCIACGYAPRTIKLLQEAANGS